MQRMSIHEEMEEDLQGVWLSALDEGALRWRSLPSREVVTIQYLSLREAFFALRVFATN